MKIIKYLIKIIAFRTGRLRYLYLKICKPNGIEWANYLRKYGNFYSIGNDCMIWPYTNITDPQYVKIGNNVILTACSIFGHDGVVAMLNKAYDKKLDSVGKIEINDNVFIGHGAIVMPGVIIGPNAVVAAGSVVIHNVLEGTVVAGVPARAIGDIDNLIAKLEHKTMLFPWNDLLKERNGSFDPLLEPELIRKRVDFFYGTKK